MGLKPVRKINTANRIDEMQEIKNRLDNHEARIETLEDMATSLGEIGETVNKILKYLKVAAPSVVSAAVAAGLVNGKLAEFFKVLFN